MRLYSASFARNWL